MYASFLYFLKRIVFVKRHVWFFRIYTYSLCFHSYIGKNKRVYICRNCKGEITVNICNDAHTFCIFIGDVYSWQWIAIFVYNSTVVSYFIRLS